MVQKHLQIFSSGKVEICSLVKCWYWSSNKTICSMRGTLIYSVAFKHNEDKNTLLPFFKSVENVFFRITVCLHNIFQINPNSESIPEMKHASFINLWWQLFNETYLTLGFHGSVLCGATVGVEGRGGVGGISSSSSFLGGSSSFNKSSSPFSVPFPLSNGFSSRLLCFIKLLN